MPVTASLAERIARTPEPWRRREILRALGDAGLAELDLIELLRDALRQRPSDPEASRRIEMFVYLASQRRGETRAAQLALKSVAGSLHVLGRPRQAAHRFEHLRSVMPPIDGARIALPYAQTLALMARFDEALAVLDSSRVALPRRGFADLRARLDGAEAIVYQAQGRAQDALRAFDRCRRVLRRTAKRATITGIDTNRATALTNLERYDQAERLYRRVIREHEASGVHAMALRAAYNHAYLVFVRGEFHRALRQFRALREQFLQAGDRRHVAMCDLDVAEISLHMNLPAHAASLARRAATELEALGIPTEVARAEFFCSVAERSLGKPDEARRRLERAEHAFREMKNAMWWGVSLHRLAELDLEEGHAGRAARRAQQAAEILHGSNLHERAGHAEVLLASIERRGGNAAGAQIRLERLLADIEERGLPWLRCEIHHELAHLHEPADVARAVRHALHATRLLEEHRVAVPPDEYMAAFLTGKARLFADAVRLVLDHGGPDAPARAFELAEQARGRALLDLLRHEDPHEAKGGDRRLQREARRLEREIDGLASRMPSIERGAHTDDANRRAAEASAREQRLRACLDRLAEYDPAAVRLRRGAAPDLAEVQAALTADETLIEYFLGNEELITFVVDVDGLRVHRRPLLRPVLRDLLTRMSFQLDRPNLASRALPALAGALLPSANAVLDELYRLLIEPIRPHLTRRRVVIVPHGDLNGLPFHALGIAGHPLLLDYEVVQAPSASIYLHCRQPRGRRYGTALILGVPDETAPDIRREVEQLSAFVPRNRCFVGKEATSANLVRYGRRARVVHIAAHARFDRTDPMESGVCLGDGWLTIPRIAELKLAPELIVLAGCATGKVSVTEGGELFGLVRGFLQAGASAMVTSFWPVPDEATTAFMQLLHRHLAAGL
ncbi:MAG: CHAT domain-containing protein, partial [Planctomycetota bacterium]|nr:CHAT domain-containing protein [Planctomycetota bacterium]